MADNNNNTISKSSWINIENVKKLQETEAKFIFEQAEKLLKDTADSANVIVTRTASILTVCSGVILGLIGFSISRWKDNNGKIDSILFTAVILCLYFLVCTLILSKNYFGFEYNTIGSEPKAIFVDTFFSYPDDQHELRLTHYYRSEFIAYQTRIETNKTTSQARWHRFEFALKMILWSPAVILTSEFLFLIFSLCHPAAFCHL